MDSVKHQDILFFNGINGSTGNYDMPPMDNNTLVDLLSKDHTVEDLEELRLKKRQNQTDHYGVKEGVDPTNLAEAGWGVITSHDVDPAVLEALKPLLDLRRDQAGDLFRMFTAQVKTAISPARANRPFWLAWVWGPVPPTLRRCLITL